MAELGRGRILKNPVTMVSEPPSTMSAERATRQAPQNLLSIVARASAIDSCLMCPDFRTAAVTTTWSTVPVVRKRASTASSLVTSAATAVTPSCLAAPSSRSPGREAIVTSAPAAFAMAAVAKPMPDEPPTTTTFLP